MEARARTRSQLVQKKKKKLAASSKNLRKLNEMLELTRRRKENFDKGDEYSSHRFNSAEEAENLVLETEAEVDKSKLENRSCEKQCLDQRSPSSLEDEVYSKRAVIENRFQRSTTGRR